MLDGRNHTGRHAPSVKTDANSVRRLATSSAAFGGVGRSREQPGEVSGAVVSVSLVVSVHRTA